MPDCLFCKIIDKSIPAEVVYEDDFVISFLDINPVNPGHVLVMPKIHHEHYWDMQGNTCEPLSSIIKKIMRVIVDSLGYDGVNLVQNNGQAAGQVIPHIHFHVIPRKAGDGHVHWQGKGYVNGQEAIWAAKIREGLSSGLGCSKGS